MPSSNEDQRRLVYAKRSQYKTKSDTPERWKWVWNSDWEEIKEIKRYKPYFKESVLDSKRAQ